MNYFIMPDDDDFDVSSEEFTMDFWIKNEGAIRKFKEVDQLKKIKGIDDLKELGVPKDGWHHIALSKVSADCGVYIDGICIQLNGKKVWRGIIQLKFRALAEKNKFISFIYHKIYGHAYGSVV